MHFLFAFRSKFHYFVNFSIYHFPSNLNVIVQLLPTINIEPVKIFVVWKKTKETKRSERFSIQRKVKEKRNRAVQTNGRNRTTPETTVAPRDAIFERPSRVRVSGAGERSRPLSSFGHRTRNYARFGIFTSLSCCSPLENTRMSAPVLSPESESSSHCVYFLRKTIRGNFAAMLSRLSRVLIVPSVKSLLS